MMNTSSTHVLHNRQQGIALIFVMLILVVVSILGVGGAQLAMMGEKGARNERDIQISRQAAETALIDAEFDIRGPGTARRAANFADGMNFIDGCGTSGISKGLCTESAAGKPTWLAINFEDDSNSAPSTFVSEQTDRTMDFGITGLKPARRSRYIVEQLTLYPAGSNRGGRSSGVPVYRVTAMGFGPRTDIQTVLQMVYRKD